MHGFDAQVNGAEVIQHKKHAHPAESFDECDQESCRNIQGT
jgi:hypothetical protein